MTTPMYSVPVAGSPDIPGEGKPRRSVLCPPELVHNYKTTKGALVSTLYENFLEGVRLAEGGPFLGHRPIVNGVPQPYRWESYSKVQERTTNFGAGLIHLGLTTQSNFVIFSINRAEWTMSELAGYSYNFVSVPLYDTLGTAAIEFIVNQTEMELIIASADKAAIVLDLKETLPSVKHVVVMGPFDEALVAQGKEVGVVVVAWTDVERSGLAQPVPVSPPQPDDIATICYTSGTTGTPK
ncbi:hypothetical protein BGZ82_001666 [Podila clonocystis]|nr:hypothetical protein BGZ82_001666 [Podila clonocystis]